MIPIDWTVSGQSPWYLERPSAALKSAEGTWTWQFAHGQPHISGLSVLTSPRGEPVLILDFQCYVLPLEGGRVLLWHAHRGRPEAPAEPPHIRFALLRLSTLAPIADLPAEAAQMRQRREGFRLASPPEATFEFITTVDEGVHGFSAPEAFHSLPDVLVLADYGPSELASNHFDRTSRAIFDFSFAREHVSVLPQKWFNTGAYDYGYQWITRVQRGSRSGQIVGEGVRLGTFRLDPSGTQIEEWLRRDDFSHPERE